MSTQKQLHIHAAPLLIVAAALFIASIAGYLHEADTSSNIGQALVQPLWAKHLPAGAAAVNVRLTLNGTQFDKAGTDTKF